MNKKRPQSVDGFRLQRRPVATRSTNRLAADDLSVPKRFLNDTPVNQPKQPTQPVRPVEERKLPAPGALSRSDLDASLREIDEQPAQPKRRRRLRFPKITKRRLVAVLLLILIGAGAYFGIKAWIAGSHMFGGNLFDLLSSGQRLKEDANGRSNILIFGTSEDDPDHEGADLTDSIMVVSISQDKKDAFMVSVPRDLWVDYGAACSSGYEGKINALYQCYSEEGRNDAAGANALRKKVGGVLGLDVQYYAKVNYTAVRDLVDAVGGVTVKIESDDPRGVLDRNFDWKCNYTCHYVKWPNGPANLNGEQALALARARNASGGYGLGGGNFDREQYQQKIMVALREKASSAGTLANPLAVNGIIDALGDNVRTSFKAGEVKTLITLASEIDSSKIKSINLIDKQHPVLTTGNYAGQSIVQPILGMYDFSDVHRYVQQKLNATGVSAENATIVVLNGSDMGGIASSKVTELEQAGFVNVTASDTPTDSSYRPIQWYDLSSSTKPKTAEKLEKSLNTPATGTNLPSGVQAEADFVIILGNGAH